MQMFSGTIEQDTSAMLVELRSDSGSGPPLVYVPGIDGTGAMLFGFEAVLAQRFRVVTVRYVHEPGKPENDTYEALAAGIVRCLDAVGIDRPLWLAESFGGAVALQGALDYPERVGALAIVNSFARYPGRWRLAVSHAVMSWTPQFLLGIGHRLFARRTLFGKDPDPDVVRQLTGRRVDWVNPGYLRRMTMIGRVDLLPRLHEIRHPVALFASDRDRVVPSRRTCQRMADRLPNAELTPLPGYGHVVLPSPSLPWTDWLEKLWARATQETRRS